MKITVCGSMATQRGLDDIFGTGKILAGQGHSVLLPETNETSDYSTVTDEAAATRKNYFIWSHFRKIEAADAILVTNGDKNGISGYIGANTFMEMTVAMYLNKKIFILNPISRDVRGYEEILGMKPTILNGNLENLA